MRNEYNLRHEVLRKLHLGLLHKEGEKMGKVFLGFVIIMWSFATMEVHAISTVEGKIIYKELGEGSAGYYFIIIETSNHEKLNLMGAIGTTFVRIGDSEFSLNYNDFNKKLGIVWKNVIIKLTEDYSHEVLFNPLNHRDFGQFVIHGIRVLK